MHGVSEYQPKREQFELSEQEKENRFNDSSQNHDTV